MDESIREIVNYLSDHGVLFAWTAGGALILAGVIALVRRICLVRQERQWFNHRVTVPKRAMMPAPVTALPTKHERRRFPRRKGNPVVIEMYDDAETGKIAEGRVIDRSMGGVCIASPTRLAVGSTLQIRPLSLRREIPSLPLEVRNARPEPTDWRLGCRYRRRPSWSVLMYLR